MTKEPPKENVVQSLALAVGKAAIVTTAAAFGPEAAIAGQVVAESIDKINRKLNEKAHRIFLEEVTSGRADLSEHEKEEFVPIAYRYYRAAQEGTVNRNLHLLAKLIRKQIDREELSYEKYVTLDNAVRDLSLEEMIVLAELCKQVGSHDTFNNPDSSIKLLVSIENYGPLDFDGLVENIMIEHKELFTCQADIAFAFSLLSAKGWAVPSSPIETTKGDDNWTSSTTFHDGYMKYRPSNLVGIIKDKIAEIDLTGSQESDV